jgi:Spy/CpxP family protein refolding chaperone
MRYSFEKYAAIAAVAAGIAFAQPPTTDTQSDPANTQVQGQEQEQEQEQGRGMWGRMDLDRMAQALNLTDTQRTQARTIFEQAAESARPIRQEMRQNRERLSAAAKVSNNHAEIQRLATEQGRLMGKVIAIRTEARGRFYQLLTPDQRVKFDQMHEQMRQQRTRTQSE